MRRARLIRNVVLGLVAAGGSTVAAPIFGPLGLRTDLEDPRSIEAFVFSDPAAWRVSDDGRSRSLELHGASKYAPPHRSPLNIALLAGVRFGDFVLEADLQQTGRDYGHRDMCVFFGYRDPAHFYYVHLATKADDHAHNIFIVDGADRRKIATKTTGGVDWGRDRWHRVRVERSITDGTIKVYFDDENEPIMTAEDRTLGWGHVGFGSFDDTGRIDNVSIVVPGVREGERGPFARATERHFTILSADASTSYGSAAAPSSPSRSLFARR